MINLAFGSIIFIFCLKLNCLNFVEYTDMAKNVLESFNEAVDRYLESDPSSEDEVRREAPVKVSQPKPKETRRREKETSSKKSKRKKRRREASQGDSASECEPERQPSLKKQHKR